jgi:glutamyl-tRNA synthetase
MNIKTRFAPSPTGYLHIGGVRTALFCWLYARHFGGHFVLRIEDTDRERSTQESIDAILTGLEWVGLDWDEGPFFQSERFDRYRACADEMLEAGTAYHCYCTADELNELRAEQVATGRNPRYDGRCRSRVEPRPNVEPVIRFKMPQTGEVAIDDQVRGQVVFSNEELDDFIIVRADGTPTFHFSVVIDDEDMGITHVIRGDDHLNNTPRHINLLNALGFRRPVYAHVPMILGADGSRLSKRHGAVNVLEYREQGYLPEALLNYLVRLGWSHGDQEIFSRQEMIDLFDLGEVNASASRFDPEKLSWMSQQYIINAPADRLVPELESQLKRLDIDPGQGPPLPDVVEAYRERAMTLAEMAQSCSYLFRDISALEPKAAKKHLRPVIGPPLGDIRTRLEALDDWNRSNVQSVIQSVADDHGLGFGKLGQPLRVAVTGGPVSPPIDVTLELVGRERALARIDAALQYIESRASASQN